MHACSHHCHADSKAAKWHTSLSTEGLCGMSMYTWMGDQKSIVSARYAWRICLGNECRSFLKTAI